MAEINDENIPARSGLGKNETGIKEAIKVKVKQDSHGWKRVGWNKIIELLQITKVDLGDIVCAACGAGNFYPIGHKKGEEFTFHWWDHMFNKAASNIDVRVDEKGVSLSKSAENGPISNKKTKRFDNKAMLYGKFVKGALLSNGKIEEISSQGSDIDSDPEDIIGRPDQLNDEELLKVCGGLTAHKAARHGHGLSGKLLRIQQQEKAELNRLTRKSLTGETTHTNSEGVNLNQDTNNSEIRNNSELKSKKKKKKKKKRQEVDEEGFCCDETDVCRKSKKRRKAECSKGDNSGEYESKKTKKRKRMEDVLHLTDKKPKKKKKK